MITPNFHPIRCCLLAIASLHGLPFLLTAAEPELSADQPIAYDTGRNQLVASGNAVFRDKGTRVKADEIRFHRDSGWIEAIGGVVVMREGIRLLTDSLRYHTESRAVHCGRFRAGYPPLFLKGDSFSGTLDQINFNKVSLAFREPQTDSPRVTIDSGTWIPDQAISGISPHLRILGPLGLPLPDFQYAAGQTVLDGDGSAGYRQNLGAFGRLALRYPFRPSLAAGGHLHLYSRRGVLLGPSFRFQSTGAGLARIDFSLDGAWIRDQGRNDLRGTDILNHPVPADRTFLDSTFYARGSKAQWQARAQLQLRSDSEVLRDFLPDRYFDQYEPDSFAEFVYQRNAFLLQLLARAQLNEDSTLIERLPQLSAEFLPTAVGQTQWVAQAGIDVLHYRLQAAAFPQAPFAFPANPLGLPDSTPPISPAPMPGRDLVDSPLYRRLSANFTLTRPIFLPAGLQLTLRAGGLARYYHRDDQGTTDQGFSQSILTGELGFDFSHKVARTWSLNPKDPQAPHAFRHVSHLQWSHRWHPGEDTSDLNQPLPSFRPYLALPPALDLAQTRLSDRATQWNVSRLAWEHQFLGLHPNQTVRQYLRLRLLQDIRLNAPGHQNEWDATYLQAAFRPFPFLQFDYSQKIRTEDRKTEATTVGLTVRSSDLWSASFSAEYLENTLEQYRIAGQYRLTQRLGLSAYWLYDAPLQSWTEQRYGLTRRFGDLWQLETYLAFTDENDREDAFSVGLRVTLLSF